MKPPNPVVIRSAYVGGMRMEVSQLPACKLALHVRLSLQAPRCNNPEHESYIYIEPDDVKRLARFFSRAAKCLGKARR